MKTALIVEDNESIREEISDILKMEDFNVIEASNGRIGYQQAVDNIPNIIISDILMPEVTGYQMFKELKNNEITKRIPFIFLSAKAEMSDIRKGMNMGAYDYLVKPLNAFDLISAVERNIQKIEVIQQDVEELKLNLSDVLPHELRTPLNGMYGLSDYLEKNINDIPADEAKEIATSLKLSTERLSIMIDDYLLYSQLSLLRLKPEGVSVLLKKEQIRINEFIYDKIENFWYKDDRKDDIDIKLHSGFIRFNYILLEKLITESLRNALKFSKKGDKIRIFSIKQESKYIVKVFNKGIGMQEDEINKISAFRQFHKKELGQQGSGLGLYTLKLISELTELEIEFKSTYMESFLITFTFPVSTVR